MIGILKKALASLLLVFVIGTQFSFDSVFASMQTADYYSFESAELFPYISSDFTRYAIAQDGTLIQRMTFEGTVKDAVVRFFGDLTFMIPLEGDVIGAESFMPVFSKAFHFMTSMDSPSLKALWQSFVMLVVIIVCGWIASLNNKRRLMLSVINRSRSGYTNYYYLPCR